MAIFEPSNNCYKLSSEMSDTEAKRNQVEN